MPGGNKEKGFPKKVTDSTFTRSKAKQQRRQHEIDSLASLSSPVTSPKPKKLSLVHEQKRLSPTDNTSPQKQADVDSVERQQETISPVVVTETEQKQGKYKSSEKENSTGSEMNLPVTQVKMSTHFDTKLEHLLTNYFSSKSKGDKHDIRQAFIKNDILTYDLLIDGWTLTIMMKMKQRKGNPRVDAFTDEKLKLVNNILLYYNFLCQDDEEALAEDIYGCSIFGAGLFQ